MKSVRDSEPQERPALRRFANPLARTFQILIMSLALLIVWRTEARVVSYAPVTNRQANPAVQFRDARHYLLLEQEGLSSPLGLPVAPCTPYTCFSGASYGRLVLYDALGGKDPRVVFPPNGEADFLNTPAMWEGEDGTLRILVGSNSNFDGRNPKRDFRYLYSGDGARTWSVVNLPSDARIPSTLFPDLDRGGPIVRNRGSWLRLGNRDMPFVFLMNALAAPVGVATATPPVAIYGLRSDGVAIPLLIPTNQQLARTIQLEGANREGTLFLLSGSLVPPSVPGLGAEGLFTLDLRGNIAQIYGFGPASESRTNVVEGWIAADGSVYAEIFFVAPRAPFTSRRAFGHFRAGNATELAAVPQADLAQATLFAIPTADYAGAWLLQRAPGRPAILSKHDPTRLSMGAVEAWHDDTSPDVEALHAAASGRKLLVQVHRPRPAPDSRLFKDPALAIWGEGTPAPPSYDELFLNEYEGRGFVHLDVDRVTEGAPFVFDGGQPTQQIVAGGPSSGPGGGGDVAQEWGVVKAALRQRLVIPVVARTPGANGSYWLTDVAVRNPGPEPVSVFFRHVPQGGGAPCGAMVEIPANTIKLFRDVLGEVFGLERSAGPLFLTPAPDGGVEATSRTYTDLVAVGESPTLGTVGMAVPAIDVFATASPRFPVSFAAGLQGSGFRTNVLATDLGGRGSDVALTFFPELLSIPPTDAPVLAPQNGQAQVNGLAAFLGLPNWQAGAVLFAPTSGESLASLIAIDNLTNDPTYFGPDLPAPIMRTVPSIVHADGAFGARFRSDIFLYNPANDLRTIFLFAKPWDSTERETFVQLTLLPNESKTIRDVLFTLFRKTGVARLRFVSFSNGQTATDGVRLTSRTYSIDARGGTYGLVVPPLNAFQSAGLTDSLEILVPVGGPRFRTNLSLVELNPISSVTVPSVSVRVEIFDPAGALLDRFEMPVPVAGGTQVNDLFRSRGLGDGPEAALIRVTPFGGLVGAYATVIDSGTNDPMYCGANLAAR